MSIQSIYVDNCLKSSWMFWSKWLSLSYIERPPRFGSNGDGQEIVTLPKLLGFAIFWNLQILREIINHRKLPLTTTILSAFSYYVQYFETFYLANFVPYFLQLGISCHCCLLYVCSATEDQERRERGHRVGRGGGGPPLISWRWGPPSWSMSSRFHFHIWYLGIWDTNYK